MNINNAFPSKYLKASDLGDKAPVVTIDRVVVEPVGQNKEMLPVIYFEGKEKGMVCNKTNGRTIQAITGTPETDEWAGTAVQLCSVQVEFQGDLVDALRVRKVPAGVKSKPAPKPELVPELTDDDIPF